MSPMMSWMSKITYRYIASGNWARKAGRVLDRRLDRYKQDLEVELCSRCERNVKQIVEYHTLIS